MVAPFAGAWIEIMGLLHIKEKLSSLPSRERGLKLKNQYPHTCDHFVAPFAGAWIEIVYAYPMDKLFIVAPFAGAWIEII